MHLKNISCIFHYSFILFMLFSAIVSALQIVFNNSLCESTAKWETCEILKEDRLLVRI